MKIWVQNYMDSDKQAITLSWHFDYHKYGIPHK